MVAEVSAKFGRLDSVVRNAGIEIKKPFLELTDEEWNRVLSVNLYGSFVVSQATARQMVRQGEGGKLIFISSVHEDIPFSESGWLTVLLRAGVLMKRGRCLKELPVTLMTSVF